ncbi:MAG: extracellular solute-binding protein, partial [Planctomycetota bacterium]
MRRLDLARFPNAAVIVLTALTFALGPSRVQAEPPAEPRNVVHLTVWQLPRPEDTSIAGKLDRAVLRAFRRKYPHIRVSSPTGITIPEASAMDTRPLMAIAGGVSPDVIYVNFRQSDTYIQEGFLYPLDEWYEKLSDEEKADRVLPQVLPVVYRWGPGRKTGEDTKKHYWALPYGLYIKGLWWRKDLFKASGLDPERPPKNWDEYYEFAQRCTDPDKGTYGIMMGAGPHWSWWFYSILCSSGAKVMQDPAGDDQWVASFNTPEARDAYEFVLKLVQGKWRHSSGKIVEGVVCRQTDQQLNQLWTQGRIAMRDSYLRDDLLAAINPELIGIAPVPVGPRGQRASELNCTMCGIFAGAAAKGRDVLEAAWNYVHFIGSPEAKAIRTRVLVENGYGLFANPTQLKKLGYMDYYRRIPHRWKETFRIAKANGEPEPYGRNTQKVYGYMSMPADEMMLAKLGHREFDTVESARAKLRRDRPGLSQAELDGELDEVRRRVRAEVRAEIQRLLNKWVDRANVKMIGRVPPSEMRVRRAVGWGVAGTIAVAFVCLFAYIARVFKPAGAKGGWMFRKHWVAYLLLVPAVGTIAIWQYYPMIRGAIIAFQDYHIVKPTTWLGIDNFANVLWEGEFWQALTNSLWYAFLAIMMGFFTPIALAILLNEIPRGKILFRTLYFLPAVISSLVVMLMWKNFYDPSDRGLLNRLVTGKGAGRGRRRRRAGNVGAVDPGAVPPRDRQVASGPQLGDGLRDPADGVGGDGPGLPDLPGGAEDHSRGHLRSRRPGRGGVLRQGPARGDPFHQGADRHQLHR